MPFRILWHYVPCVYAGSLGTLLSLPFAINVETDWLTRLSMILGAGGLAAIIIALTRFKIAGSVVRKTDAETISSQFVLIVERLQQEGKTLSNRLESANQREALMRVSKHEALKHNQAMIFHIQNVREIVIEFNALHKDKIVLPEFSFTPLTEILAQEDEKLTEFVDSLRPIHT
jgi:hypothetical protein